MSQVFSVVVLFVFGMNFVYSQCTVLLQAWTDSKSNLSFVGKKLGELDDFCSFNGFT